MPKRFYKKERKSICSKCLGPIEESRIGKYGYCKKCHAEWMRAYRVQYADLTDDQKIRANARAMVRVYVKRGSLIKLSCQICGYDKVEAHHSDYSKPLDIIWLCRGCHLKCHSGTISEEDIATLPANPIIKKVEEISRLCSHCEGPLEASRMGKARYCLKCHAEYMKGVRKRAKEKKEKLEEFYKLHHGSDN